MTSLLEHLKSKTGNETLSFQLKSPKIVEDIKGKKPDKDLVFVKWEVAHTLPMINRNGLGISLISAEKSIKTAINKNVNVEHKTIKNIPLGIEPPIDEDGNPISLIIGHIIDAEVGGESTGQTVAVPSAPVPMFFTTAMHRQEPFVQRVLDDILDAHVTGRESIYKASVEFGRMTDFEDDMIFDGSKLFSIMYAPEDLQEKFRHFDRKPIQHNGRVAGLVVGGNAGIVFSGLAVTVNPADVETRPLEFAASANDDGMVNAGECVNSYIHYKLVEEGDLNMLNEKFVDFLGSTGIIKPDELVRAKAAMKLLHDQENSKNLDEKQYADAVNNLASVLKGLESSDLEKVIQEKVDKKLSSDDFIKKEELESKIEARIGEMKKDKKLFTEEDLETAVKGRLEEINSINDKVEKWLSTLEEKGIDINKLNTALKEAGQTRNVREQLIHIASNEDADGRFEKSINFFQLMGKGADAINSVNPGNDTVIPKVNDRVLDLSTESLMESFM